MKLRHHIILYAMLIAFSSAGGVVSSVQAAPDKAEKVTKIKIKPAKITPPKRPALGRVKIVTEPGDPLLVGKEHGHKNGVGVSKKTVLDKEKADKLKTTKNK